MSGKLFCLGSPDVDNFYVEVEALSRQRVVEVDHDGFVLDFVDAHRDGLSLRALGHQHGSDLLSVRRNLLFRNFFEGLCRTIIWRAPTYRLLLGVEAISGGLGICVSLLLGIRPFIE